MKVHFVGGVIVTCHTGIIHESEKCLGQVTVWESMQMEFEVVNIHTEEMILWRLEPYC
jgi:hypothetical protein